MAFHVITPDHNKYAEAANSYSLDQSTIEERISLVKAEEILEEWKKIQLEAELELGEDKEALLENQEGLKEKLFVQFGEDVDDIFLAFKHYGLNHYLSEEDRKKYTRLLLINEEE